MLSRRPFQTVGVTAKGCLDLSPGGFFGPSDVIVPMQWVVHSYQLEGRRRATDTAQHALGEADAGIHEVRSLCCPPRLRFRLWKLPQPVPMARKTELRVWSELDPAWPKAKTPCHASTPGYALPRTRAPHLLSRGCDAAYAPGHVEQGDAREEANDGHKNSLGLFSLRSG